MTHRYNAHGQPIGAALDDWIAPTDLTALRITGRYCALEPLDADRHGQALFNAWGAGDDEPSWTYLAYGPFAYAANYRRWITEALSEPDSAYMAIIDRRHNAALGVCGYLNMRSADGVVEIGHIHYADALKGTRAATEAQYRLMQQAFGSGYRRYEWKCDALNAASRRAAERLGFMFEGIFRQHRVYNGRNRDTAWFSIIDTEWPALDAAYRTWLAPDNFDDIGQQKQTLSELTASARQTV